MEITKKKEIDDRILIYDPSYRPSFSILLVIFSDIVQEPVYPGKPSHRALGLGAWAVLSQLRFVRGLGEHVSARLAKLYTAQPYAHNVFKNCSKREYQKVLSTANFLFD